MELSACIVVYNGAEEALRAAQTVLDCTRRHPLTLYLVDNASPDGSGQRLTRAAADGTLRTAPGQQVQVLCRTQNGGFGTGHNTVLSLLQSRVHFILNPDIQLTTDTLSDLADWMVQHPGVVMARPALTFPDGQPQRLPLRPLRSSSAPAASRRWTQLYSKKSAVLTRATSCMWRMPTSPRKCAQRARRIWCPSTRPSMPGTGPPTAV